MNRKDLIDAVSKALPSRADAVTAVRVAFETIRAALNRGEKVMISNFGAFRVKEHPPGTRRNPKTGQTVSVPTRRRVRFKASRRLLD